MPHIVAGNYFVQDQTGILAERPLHRPKLSVWQRLLGVVHRNSLVVFACFFLLIGASAIIVGAAYWSAHITSQIAVRPTTGSASAVHVPSIPLHGPNAVVANSDLAHTLQTISSQPISLIIADNTVPLDAATIKSWIKVVGDKPKGVSYLHVNQAAIASSLTKAVAPYAKAPTDQVSVTYADGSSAIIVAGHNGTKVHDTAAFAQQIGADLLAAKGQQLPVPTDDVAFAAVTPTAFDKLLEVNVVTKQMWAYEKGNLVNQWPVSAGAPETPTPIGQYKIYQKLTIQDMKGLNADGTKYLQPHVHWINYFLPGGYAVHGNYWRPLSWFGAINSSHGCVSLPDDQAEWVYNWAPTGTTVITHT